MRAAIVEGRDKGPEFSVMGTTVIGRDPRADVVVADTEVSARHASLESRNGALLLGDRIPLGGTVFELQLPARPEAKPVADPGALR